MFEFVANVVNQIDLAVDSMSPASRCEYYTVDNYLNSSEMFSNFKYG